MKARNRSLRLLLALASLYLPSLNLNTESFDITRSDAQACQGPPAVRVATAWAQGSQVTVQILIQV